MEGSDSVRYQMEILEDEITRTSVDLCGTKSAMIQNEMLDRLKSGIQYAEYGKKIR